MADRKSVDDAVARWEPLLSEECATRAGPWLNVVEMLAMAANQLMIKDKDKGDETSGRLFLFDIERTVRREVKDQGIQAELLTPIALSYKAIDEKEWADAADALDSAGTAFYYYLADVILKCECPKWQKKQTQ